MSKRTITSSFVITAHITISTAFGIQNYGTDDRERANITKLSSYIIWAFCKVLLFQVVWSTFLENNCHLPSLIRMLRHINSDIQHLVSTILLQLTKSSSGFCDHEHSRSVSILNAIAGFILEFLQSFKVSLKYVHAFCRWVKNNSKSAYLTIWSRYDLNP